MPGSFHEFSLATPDIGASTEFYENLGFWQAPTGDAWPHRYGVVTDGRLVLGLHEAADFAALTFIHPDLALTLRRTDPEVFNQLEFADPAGQKVRMVAARTFSPAAAARRQPSRLGHFAQYGIPARDP